MKNNYTHVVKSILSKRTDGKINPCHEIIEGQKCFLGEQQNIGSPYYFLVESKEHPGTNSWIRTSSVESFTDLANGTIILETRNSTYTFEKLEDVTAK